MSLFTKIFAARCAALITKCLLFLTVSTAFADTSTVILCFFPGSGLTTGSGSCGVEGPADLSGFSGVQAASSVAFTAASSLEDFTTLHFSQSVTARAPLGTPYNNPLPIAISNAGLSNIVLTTAGSTRTGFVQVVYNPFVTVTSEGINGNYAISLPGVPTVGCDLIGVTSTDNCRLYSHEFATQLLPFDLGAQFSFDLKSVLTAYGNPNNNYANASVDVEYRFRFWEADGTTPVEATLVTPEPATWTLMLLAVSLAFLFWHARQTD